ncbi:MAG: DHA2 family efflux MFS transporter permease subunit [Thermoleophilia bacterium]
MNQATLAPTAAPAGPASEEGHPHKWLILAAVSLGMFMTLLDVTIVNIAIPAVIKDLRTTVTTVSWVVNAYSLALAVLFLSLGRLGDKFGLKLVFLGGLAVFSVFSLACALAPTINWLIGFRVAQGVGGAAMAPISLAILFKVFPRRQQGMAVGLWGALGAVAAAVGPTLGGLLVEYASWHWVFFINVPIGAGALAFCWLVVPKGEAHRSSSGIDLVGVVISAVGLFCLILALIETSTWGWTSTKTLALFVVAVASFPLFAWWELRSPSPMFDFRLLRIRSFTAANTTMLLIGATMGGALFLLPIFLISVLGYSELKAAIAITPMPLVGLVLGPLVGGLTDRIGPRLPAAIGVVFFGVGMLLLAQLGGQSTALSVGWRVVFLGVGMGFVFPSVSSAAMGSLPPQVSGVGSAALNTLRQVGFSLGIAVLIAIFSQQMVTNVATAVRQSQNFVKTQTVLPALAQQQIEASLVQTAQAAKQGGGMSIGVSDSLAGLPTAPPGTPVFAEQAKLRHTIGAIFRDDIAKSFRLSYYAAAAVAFLALIPALFTGRRLGEFQGHEAMSRAERAADTA